MKRIIPLFVLLVMGGFGQAAPVALSPGVLLDLESHRAFVVDPSGFTQRLDLHGGAASWVSPEIAYPLVLADGVLVTLAAPDARGAAVLLLLDPGSGAVIDRISVDLPESVSANFFPSPKRRFKASAIDTPDGVRIFWSQESRTLRGAAIVEVDADGNEVINPATIEQGAFDLVRDQDRYFAIPVRSAFALPTPPVVALADRERLADVPGVQLRAADNRHVQTAQTRPHETFGLIHQWSIHDRTGQRLGGYASPYAYTPFVVDDGTMVIRDLPIGFAASDGRWVERGTSLVAIDLASGTERWRVPVLDDEYRGPMPP